ncbi:hypothetical protein ABPG72_015561 [Tetrahymena utriculariae]
MESEDQHQTAQDSSQEDLKSKQEQFLKNVESKAVKIGENRDILYVQNIFTILQHAELPFKLTEKEDIIKDIYEGGFKVWECTIDLLSYLHKNNFDFQGKTVMDLGCGHGLLGIYAMQQGAKQVLFQDYNYEVLSIAVRLNIILNKVPNVQERLIYLSGEWNNLENKIAQQINEVGFFENKVVQYENQFDLLMLSEVIYNQANYEKVTNLIYKLMKPNGICLLANKLYYFGVGGSMPEFKQYLQTNHSGKLQLESLEIVNNKKGNKREIVVVRKL